MTMLLDTPTSPVRAPASPLSCPGEGAPASAGPHLPSQGASPAPERRNLTVAACGWCLQSGCENDGCARAERIFQRTVEARFAGRLISWDDDRDELNRRDVLRSYTDWHIEMARREFVGAWV